jgi:uncharacterized Zn finger protein (UPF0148 family)
MSYIVRTKGEAVFKAIDLMCPNCGYHEELLTKDSDGDREIKCPNCEECEMSRVWLSAPTVNRYADENSPQAFEARKRSFQKRFLDKEADDIRHKHGVNFDDSLRSAAAQRIKNGEEPT